MRFKLETRVVSRTVIMALLLLPGLALCAPAPNGTTTSGQAAVTAGGAPPPGGAPSGGAPAGGPPGGGAPVGGPPGGGAPGGAPPGGGAPGGGAPGGAPAVAGGSPASAATAPKQSAAQIAQQKARQAAARKIAAQEAKDQAAQQANVKALTKIQLPTRPAFMVPLAAKGVMLAIAQAGNHLVAVGAHGDIVTSSDGKHWKQSPSPVRQMLTAVDFVDADNGWAVGHDSVIIHSGDGGKTWKLQAYQPKLQAPLLNVLFLTPQHGFAMGAFGQLRETTDGGATWNGVNAPNIRGPQLNFYDMIQLGDGSLLVVGEQGIMALSTDQGATWKKLTSPYKASLFGALPNGDKGALIYGMRGNAFITTDVAQGDWKQVPTHVKASFYGGARLKSGAFVLVGTRGKLMRISADGNTVETLDGPSDQDYDTTMQWGDGLVLAGLNGMQWLKLSH